jgi:DNA-binding NarL/FixJ family response regulator
MPDDAQAWLQVLGGVDRALEHDVSPGARRSLLLMRTRTAFLARRPQLEAAPEPANVIPLRAEGVVTMGTTYDPCPLSGREHEVLRLLGAGMVYKAIAAELAISPNTVRQHASHIYEKLDVTDRPQAVLLAHERGWV